MGEKSRDERIAEWIKRRMQDPSHKEWLADIERQIRTGDVERGYDAAQLRALFFGDPSDTAPRVSREGEA